MPWKTTMDRARQDLREGKRPTTAAGEFVKEEMEHVRRGKHGARSPRQAIAIGLNKARRAGVPLPPPGKRQAGSRTRRFSESARRAGRGEARDRRPSRRRSEAVKGALRRERRSSASHAELSRQAREASRRRRRKSR
ncbi:MAG TPA: transcription elongation factor [Anaeromyxobacter sp.]|nr:transcription elongation factor [Anaeromyxobacter sp.]